MVSSGLLRRENLKSYIGHYCFLERPFQILDLYRPRIQPALATALLTALQVQTADISLPLERSQSLTFFSL
jgi:hypothetical protein